MTVRPKKIDGWPGAAAINEGIPEGWYTRKQAAQAVGRSKDTIIRWQEDGVYAPSGYTERGELVVWLYSEEDIANLRQIAAGMKPGRKPKEDEEHAQGSGEDHV